MKTVFIKEIKSISTDSHNTIDLTEMKISHCIGCWTCWWKTPGRCVYKELDEFYHQYITADKVVFLAEVSRGFVSSRLKTLFDRMIPLFLPYTTYKTGESMHVKRYEKYPDIEFYYQGEFADANGRDIFEAYIHRVFYQFYSQRIIIKPIEEYKLIGGDVA